MGGSWGRKRAPLDRGRAAAAAEKAGGAQPCRAEGRGSGQAKNAWLDALELAGRAGDWGSRVRGQVGGIEVRAVDVSNFTVENIRATVEATSVYPVVNQVEVHPLLQQPELEKYCQEHNIHITAYSPLGNNFIGKPNLTENLVVIETAKRLDATPAQVLIAWSARRGHSVVPKSAQEARIISNFQEIEITDEDFARIAKLGEGDLRVRYNIPFCYNPAWSISIFKEETEKAARVQVKIN